MSKVIADLINPVSKLSLTIFAIHSVIYSNLLRAYHVPGTNGNIKPKKDITFKELIPTGNMDK